MSAFDQDLDSTRRDTHYGGIPHAEILKKMEETDMYEGDDYDDNSVEYRYNAYARSEIIDKNPDAPFFEADKTRRDPSRSLNKLNLQYNATRGNSAEIPTHPEMFLGFTDPDPRGVVNDPRLDKAREYVSGMKAARLQIPMGNNDENHIADEPWTAQAIQRGKQETFKVSRKNLKIFTQDRLSRSTGNNTISGDYRRVHNQTGENTANRDIFKETEIYKSTPNPEDSTYIYRKADFETTYKAQLANLNMSSKSVLDDLGAIQHKVQQLGKFNNSVTATNNTQKSHYDLQKLQRMSDHMAVLHNQIVNLNLKTPSNQNISKAKYLTEQLTNLKNEINSISLAPGIPAADLGKISRQIDHMITLQDQINSVTSKSAPLAVTGPSRLPVEVAEMVDSTKTQKYKKAVSESKQVHSYVDYVPMAESEDTKRFKSIDDHGDVRGAINQIFADQIMNNSAENFATKSAEKNSKQLRSHMEATDNGRETVSYKSVKPKSGQVFTEQMIDFADVDTSRTGKSQKIQQTTQRYEEENMDHDDQLVMKKGGVKKMPKSLRKVQFNL